MDKRIRWRVRQLRREMAAREGRDIKLDEVAQQTGIAVSTLSNIENNKVERVAFSTIERLASFYQVESIAALLELEIRRSRVAAR